MFKNIFFAIGIYCSLKFAIRNLRQLREYWKNGKWATKWDCIINYVHKKIRKEPLVICNYGSSNEYNQDSCDFSKNEDINKFLFTQDEEDIEVTLVGFKNMIEAKSCCKKLNQSDRHIYEVEGKVYALVEAVVSEEEMQNYGAILLSDDEKYDILNEIVEYDSRLFEFMDEETASFFIYKFSVQSIINYMNHVFVDLSEREDLNMNIVRRLASECMGLEVSDKFLIAKLKSIKEN